MLKKELLNLLNNVNDEGNVDEILQGTDLYKSMQSLDKFKELVATNQEFKSFMDSEKDKYNAKALETWKTNNLEKLINDEILKRNPKQDPKDLQLQELQKEIQQMKAEKLREQLINKAIKFTTDKQLPSEMVDMLIGDDENTTMTNLSKFEEVMKNYKQKLVITDLKNNIYNPPKNNNDFANNNPYSSEHFSLTKQMELEMQDAELAKKLREQANIK